MFETFVFRVFCFADRFHLIHFPLVQVSFVAFWVSGLNLVFRSEPKFFKWPNLVGLNFEGFRWFQVVGMSKKLSTAR